MLHRLFVSLALVVAPCFVASASAEVKLHGLFSSHMVLQQGIELLREKLEDEALERAALAEILGKRRSGPFISATRMDSQLSRMIGRKRRAHAVRD